MEPILHIARAEDWAAALASGSYRVSTLGRTLEEVGFIHCSLPHQVAGVADAYYRGTTDLVMLTIDPDRVEPDIRYEPAAGTDERFPHIYGALSIESVIGVEPFEVGGPAGPPVGL